MAKKDKDAPYEAFLADLKAINPQFEELLKDEKASAKLREGVLAKAELSSQLDTLRTERETFNTQVQEARDRIAGWQKWYADTTSEVATMHDQLTKYRDTYGDLTEGEKRKAASEMGISKQDLEKLLAEREQQRDVANLKFADDLSDIKLDYRDRFKEKLNTEAVYKIAGERGVDLVTAYNFHIADKVEEARNKDVEERIKKERADAVAEFASQHKLPVVSSQSDMVHILDVKDAPNTSRERIAAALNSFNTARR